MGFSTKDVVPLSQARAKLSELADEVKAGAEKIITKNGESYVALIDAARLDHYHRLERARIQLVLLEEIAKGAADVDAGRTSDARAALHRLLEEQRRRLTLEAIADVKAGRTHDHAQIEAWAAKPDTLKRRSRR